MKLTSITARIASAAALLAASSTLAQAHPGLPGHLHFSDPQASAPVIALGVLAILTLATAMHRLAPRKR